MKLLRFMVLTLISVAVILTVCACAVEKMTQIEFTELGIPTANKFTAGTNACCPWDLAYFDGKLFVGSGDYDVNAGPIDIQYYDFENGSWESGGTVNDEEISRFRMIDDRLIAPGIDPREEWEYGNYYEYDAESESFNKVRTIPGGIHTFDIEECHGKIFAGLGVDFGEYPAACSEDGGKTFYQIPFYKNGELLNTESFTDYSRVYNIIVYNNEVYAAYRYNIDGKGIHEFYKYENGAFVYYSDFMGKLEYLKIGYNPIHSRAEADGRLYLATGSLYYTTDLINYTEVTLSGTDYVTDLYLKDGMLYALGYAENADSTYSISVYKKSGNEFTKLFYFNYSLPAMSMVYENGNFYFGMGKIDSGHEKNGMILSVEYR